MIQKLVIFDFDGTITTKDTFPLFFKYSFGSFKYYIGFLIHIPYYILFKLNILNGEYLKLSILNFYLRKKSKLWIEEQGREFILHLINEKVIKPQFLDKINSYQKRGFEIAIVSASPDIWIKAFCKTYNLQCICTELNYQSDVYTGVLKTKNCNHQEKKIRIQQHYNLSDFKDIIVYGDSEGDAAMMELAKIKNWVN